MKFSESNDLLSEGASGFSQGKECQQEPVQSSGQERWARLPERRVQTRECTRYKQVAPLATCCHMESKVSGGSGRSLVP